MTATEDHTATEKSGQEIFKRGARENAREERWNRWERQRVVCPAQIVQNRRTRGMLHLDLVQLHIRRSLKLAPCIRSFVRHLPIIQYVTDCNLLTNLTKDTSLTRNGSERERERGLAL